MAYREGVQVATLTYLDHTGEYVDVDCTHAHVEVLSVPIDKLVEFMAYLRNNGYQYEARPVIKS